MDSVKLTDIIENFKLENLIPDINTDDILITNPDLNRPALQLTGFYEHFDNDRIQIIGNVEYAYLQFIRYEFKNTMYDRLLRNHIPCLIFCRDLDPDEYLINLAKKHRVCILKTNKITSTFESELNKWLHVKLAPTIRIHGVLVDVYGEGILITGESGIGKSEAALELVKRGHRLVSDDAVEICKVSETTLIGSAPDITRHMIELRGIGIVDIKTMFGVSSVKDTQTIDLTIHLEEWNRDKTYDRIGLEENFKEILGKEVPLHTIPIRPGRNIAIIVESAAINFRQKKMGYNAAKELYKRIQAKMDGEHE